MIFAGSSFLQAQESSDLAPVRNPEWVKSSSIYQVYLRDFSVEGKFSNLENDLLRLKNLGVSCVLLLPIHPSGTAVSGELAHPFHVKDFSAVSLEYGTKDGFKSLTEQVHYNEMKIILSWVVDRASSETPLLKDHPDWFVIKSTQNLPALIRFDYASKEARNYMKDQLVFWLREYALDGFHLIGAENVPEDYLFELKRALSLVKPSCVVIGKTKSSGVQLYEDENFYTAVAGAVSGKEPASGLESILNEDARQGSSWPWPLRSIEHFDAARSSVSFGNAFAPAAVLEFCLDGVPLVNAGQEILESRQNSPVKKNAIDWVSGLRHNAETRKFYKKLISFRSKHPSLSRGQKFFMPSGNAPSVFAFAASYREDVVMAAVNFSGSSVSASVQVPDIFLSNGGKLKLRSVFEAGELVQTDGAQVNVNLPAWGYEIWHLE